MVRKIFFLLVLTAGLMLNVTAHAETLGVYQAKSGTGWLERTGQGDLVLHLEGNWYDMGYEQGQLLRKESLMTMRGAQAYVHKMMPLLPGKTLTNLLYKKVYLKSEPYVPEMFKQEMQGLADAGGVTVKEIAGLHSLIYLASCSTTAAFGPATKDGGLLQTRSLDFILGFIDPQTKTPMQDNSLIVVYKPIGGVPFVTFSWPGVLGSVGGMNAQGISISEMTLPSRYESPAGLSMIWRIKQALAKAETLDQAVDYMTRKPFEGGYLFVVGDGKIPAAKAIEMDAKTVYVGGWDGPAESNHYRKWGKAYSYEPKPGLMVRTNHPLSNELLKDYPAPIDAAGMDSMSGARYRDLKKRDLQAYGSLDLEKIFLIMREHYQGMCKAPDYKGCAGVNYQAAMAPQSGDFIISFAHGNPYTEGTYHISAYNKPYHKYNLVDLLNEKPE